MRKYLVKRLLLSVVILFFVTFIIYVLMRCMPSSYVENMARQLSQAPGSKPYEEWLAQLNAQYGLDLGLIPGFFVQLKNLCTGNFGDSWKYTVPVIQKFNEVIWVSFIMGAISLVFELLIAVPLGIVAATKQYSVTDYTVTTVALLGMSLPTFFFATLLKLIFCIKLGWFDLVGLTGRDFNSLSQFGQILDMAKHLVLPIVTLVFISIGPWMRYVRTNMLEVLNADYIRTARAKGLSEHKVIYHHAFRNTLIPLVTIIGGSLPGLFSGALITETLFSIPGIGYISYQSMVAGDIPFTMFYLSFMAVLTLASNLLTSNNYSLSLNAATLGLAQGEYVTDVRFEFGTVPSGFASVVKPTMRVQVLGTVSNGYQIINRADVGGQYLNEWQTAKTTWVTTVRRFNTTPLPKTGY